MIKRYQKKPVAIRAIQYDGTNAGEIREFCGDYCIQDNITGEIRLKTLEDRDDTSHYVSKGDFIIEGVHGEFYACKPDIFMETYEELPPKMVDLARNL